MQDDPQGPAAGGTPSARSAEPSDRESATEDTSSPVVRVHGVKARDAGHGGRPRATGAAAYTSVVAESAAADSHIAVSTGPRGSRAPSRARATKGAGVIDRANAVVQAEAATTTLIAPDDPAAASERTVGPERIAAPVETQRPAPAPRDAVTSEAVQHETEAVLQETERRTSSDEGVDTGPMPMRSNAVDENTGSRQRITLFGRRRRAAAAAAALAAAEQENTAEAPDPLAELVRETESADGTAEVRASVSTAAPAISFESAETAKTAQTGVPDWIVEQVLESDERDEALAGTSDAALAEETVDRATIARERASTSESDLVEAEEGTETVSLPRARRAATTRAFPPARPAPAVTAPVVLAVNGLHKRYGDVVAVDGVSLSIRAGSLYGIVGPNGAGKTTTLSIITGLLRADSGAVYVNGVDALKHPRDAKRAIGVLPDHLRTFDRLTGAQLLFYAGTLRGLDATTTRQRSADLATAFGIEDAMGRLVADYSAGMTKKVSLAAAMIHSPRLLVLDEPFEGVDPVSAATVTGILQRYVDAGGTVLLSSHGMDLVQRICDSVAIIVGGVVLDAGPVDQVRGDKTLEDHFIELAGGRKAAEGLEWLHSFSD